MVAWLVNEATGWLYVIIGIIMLGLCFSFVDLLENVGKIVIKAFKNNDDEVQ